MVEALISQGLFREALDRVRGSWGGMIRLGATTFWETFDPESPEGTLPQRLWSLCHEFCSGPVYSLPAHFAGIRAMQPGFGRVEIAPHLMDIGWIDCSVPTPKGSIRVLAMQSNDRRALEMDVSVPADVACEGAGPMFNRDNRKVYLNGHPLLPNMTVETIRDLREDLEAVTLAESGIRLIFTALPTPKSCMYLPNPPE